MIILFLHTNQPNNEKSYEQLARHYPENDHYKLYYAQSLQKSGQYQAALKACLNIENPELSQKVLKLQASIKYESNDLVGCKALIDDCPADDPDTMVNQACFLFKVIIDLNIYLKLLKN